MRIAVVGPDLSVARVLSVSRQARLPVDLLPCIYKNYTEAPALLEPHQATYHAVLFTGETPYEYALHHTSPTCPWEYLKDQKVEFAYALLKAVQIEKKDITRISLDSHDRRTFSQAFQEIGFCTDNIVAISAMDRQADDYIAQLVSFHCRCYESGDVTCCVAGMTAVYQQLTALGIPTIYIERSEDSILSSLQHLMLSTQIGTADRDAVVAMEFRAPAEPLTYQRTPLQDLPRRSRLLECLYRFAQAVGAALFPDGSQRFYLVTRERRLADETQDLRTFPLLKQLQELATQQDIAMGVGLGESVATARQSADLALRQAWTIGESCAFIFRDLQPLSGPIFAAAESETEGTVDEALLELSRHSGIGIDTLGRLGAVLRRFGGQAVTPARLAAEYGIGLRSMNRILVRLEEAGLVTVVGKEAHGGRGRPGRLLKIQLLKE